MADANLAERGTSVLPSGTVTFLFTDIEGSTQRWERDRAAMAGAVTRHDALVRRAIETHGGFVFKTIGDAFCAAFAEAPNAIAAALDAQRVMAGEDWTSVDGLRVRMSVHTGNAEQRAGDYFGPTVNRVARLLSIGHGGQVLVSGVATDLAQGQMPPQATLHDLGSHRLKDLAQPEQVYQLLAPGLPREFPALRSLGAMPNNLPLQLTSFVGRDEEIAALDARIQTTRLLTLVGAGGVGKTRMSLQVGADVLERFEDGVWFVDLAPLSDPMLVGVALATALGVEVGVGQAPRDAVLLAYKKRRALVIFDNCEHLVAAAAETIDALLHACPDVKVLASSREGLGIAGEAVFRMPSLSLPPRGENVTAESAHRYGSLALFIDRASAASDRFSITDENAPALADICRRLDGIALAIELAAPRVKALSVEQLSQRLDERFRILTGGSRTALPRQQTLRALIDWSYDLLSENERTVFRRVGVFVGGWNLDAAGAVCADDAIESWDVLDLLSSLVDKSLVVADLQGSEQRYRLLESGRAYALERLAQSGERDDVARRHALYFLSVAQRSDETYGTVPQVLWERTYEMELDNFRAALEWSFGSSGDVAIATGLAGTLELFYSRLGLLEEALRWLDLAMERASELGNEVVARLWVGIAEVTANMMLKTRRLEAAERAVELLRGGDSRLLHRALHSLGDVFRQLARAQEARPHLVEALALSRRLGNRYWIASTIGRLALVEFMLGNFDGARSLYEEVRSGAHAIGYESLTLTASLNFAEMEFGNGNVDRAIAIARENLANYERLRNANAADNQKLNLLAYLAVAEDVGEALPIARQLITALRQRPAPIFVAFSMQHVALLAAMTAHPHEGARLLGFADGKIELLGSQRELTEQREFDILTASLQRQLAAHEFDELTRAGRTLSTDEALDVATIVVDATGAEAQVSMRTDGTRRQE